MNFRETTINSIFKSDTIYAACQIFAKENLIDIAIFNFQDKKAVFAFRTNENTSVIPIYLLYQENEKDSHIGFLYDLSLR